MFKLPRLPHQAALLCAIVLGVSCAPTPAPGAAPGRVAALQGTPGQLTAALATSDLAVGTDQRFLLVIIGPDNALVTDAEVDLAFFKVTGPGTAQLRSTATSEMKPTPGLPGRGVYLARADFDEAGEWGVAARVARPAAEPAEVRISFQIKERSATPRIGDPVPASRTLTGTTEREIEAFSSARPVDPSLYRLSIADAISARKPFAVLFATPGFCTSRTCGPSLDVLQALKGRFGTDANFIHVEIYKDGRPGEMVPSVAEWGLPSEPWLFLVDADGRLAEKLEGSITVDEAAPALARLLTPRPS